MVHVSRRRLFSNHPQAKEEENFPKPTVVVLPSTSDLYNKFSGAGVAQYGVRLQTGRLGYRDSIPGWSKRIFSFSLCVQTSSETHPASCPMGKCGPFPGDKARVKRDADHLSHLVPMSRMSRSYTSCGSMVRCRTALLINVGIQKRCVLGKCKYNNGSRNSLQN
jgi:hypothetical protein